MQQRVEILKTLYRDARILVLDEPTAVLTAQETHELFQVLRALRDDGVAIVFISHKLGEVLEIADRVTVLRRGKKIDTVPTEGATEQSLARLMVGRDVLLRVERSRPSRASRCSRSRTCTCATTAGSRRCEGVSLDGARRRDRRRSPGWTATASTSWCEAIAGAARRRVGAASTIGGRGGRGEGVRAHLRRRRGAHPRGPPAARAGARLHAGGEPRPARVPLAADLDRGGLARQRHDQPRARALLKEYDVRGGEREHARGSLSGGNQQKVVHRARDRQQPEAADRRTSPRAGSTWARSSSSTAGCSSRARRGPRDPAGVARVRGGPLARRPHPRDLRGADRRRVPARRLRGGARLRDDRRRGAGPRRERRRATARAAPQTPASRLAAYVRGGGVIVAAPDRAARLPHRRAGGARHRPRPDRHLQGDLRRHRASSGCSRGSPATTATSRRSNLQQTLIITTPLILTGLAVAFAFRAGLFNIGGNGQYIVGSIAAVWVGSSFAGMPSFLHIVLAILAACLAGAVWAGIAGVLKATRGRQRGDQHDHAQLDRALGRASGCSRSAGRCRTTRRSRSRSRTTSSTGRQAAACSGATRCSRASTSASSSRSPRCSSSGSS